MRRGSVGSEFFMEQVTILYQERHSGTPLLSNSRVLAYYVGWLQPHEESCVFFGESCRGGGEVSGTSCRPLSVEPMMPPLLCLLSADVIWLALLFIAMTTSRNVMGCAIRMVIDHFDHWSNILDGQTNR